MSNNPKDAVVNCSKLMRAQTPEQPEPKSKPEPWLQPSVPVITTADMIVSYNEKADMEENGNLKPEADAGKKKPE